MRLYCAAFCLFACNCIPATYDQVDYAIKDATACIRQEAAVVAPEPVDLDGATVFVLDQCAAELANEHNAVLARYGLDRDIYEPPGKELAIMRKNDARDTVASLRSYFRVHHR
jgi:hypothetical protein